MEWGRKIGKVAAPSTSPEIVYPTDIISGGKVRDRWMDGWIDGWNGDGARETRCREYLGVLRSASQCKASSMVDTLFIRVQERVFICSITASSPARPPSQSEMGSRMGFEPRAHTHTSTQVSRALDLDLPCGIMTLLPRPRGVILRARPRTDGASQGPQRRLTDAEWVNFVALFIHSGVKLL